MEASTQQFIEISGIKDGVIILKNGGYRLIMSTSAVNFSLKSEEEQNSLIFQYQSFLNSLHFPIQIVVQSKKLDLTQYLKKVNKEKDKQTNELIKMQTEDYIEFVGQLINVANIMKKTFYVVVSYDPINLKSASVVDRLFFKKSIQGNVKVSEPEFKRYKEQLLERANIAATGLGGMGLRCVQLTTEEIIELFYKVYNPEVADKEKFSDIKDITSTTVVNKNEVSNNTIASTTNEESEEENIIDNSALVEEQHRQKMQEANTEDKAKEETPPPTQQKEDIPAQTQKKENLQPPTQQDS